METVLVPPGLPIVLVMAPPGPSQISPIGQQPYFPLFPNQQTELTGHPPLLSGQQVSRYPIHPEPQSVRYESEQGARSLFSRTEASKKLAREPETARPAIRKNFIVDVDLCLSE